jgi:chromosome condensin MukBEF ATPase and DNA-binding subunit MukB
MLTFYKEEAEKNYQVFIDFQLKSDNFNKIKAAMDAKSASSRTQQDVDAFNKAVKEFNQAVNELNQKNNSLNDTRSKLLNNWNSTADKFTSSHNRVRNQCLVKMFTTNRS